MYDLRSIKTFQSIEHPIKDADGNPTGVVFTLAGPTHPQRKAAEHARQRKLIREAGKTGRLAQPDPAETEAERPKLLAAMTLGWSGYGVNGQPVPFSVEAAEALYADPDLAWLTEQVDAALADRQLFTKPASAS
ncbi:MAG: hypothetical protein M0Q87_06400 [Ottowia sp.]|nr:hypothetical protein [Ottowia sp.]